jgi:hypothetical protein
MNGRIKELMLEAGYAAPELAGRANKFAELIVRECAVVGMVMTDDHFDVDALYKHFGIEQ